jgi:hypothetical protein
MVSVSGPRSPALGKVGVASALGCHSEKRASRNRRRGEWQLCHHSWRENDGTARLPGGLGLGAQEGARRGRNSKDATEKDLYRHRQELFGELSIAFSIRHRCTSRAPADPGQLGHSKDDRAHLKQMGLGTVLDGDSRAC